MRLALDLDLDLRSLRLQGQPEQFPEGNATRNQQPLDGLAHVRVGTCAKNDTLTTIAVHNLISGLNPSCL